MTRLLLSSMIVAVYMPFCGPLDVKPTAPPIDAQKEMRELWTAPRDVAAADMTYGPWGKRDAPDPSTPFTYRKAKTHGVSPGYEVDDADGREWSVKFGDEGHVEVVLSRVLSALGYHQPPVYYVEHFKLRDDKGTHDQGGGRFRLKIKDLKDHGEWAWQQNPFVGTEPYQGLLVVMMLFDSTDLKNSNNTLYEFKGADGEEPWYVVRDLGSALGETGRLNPERNNPELLARDKFISGVHDRFVVFDYHGYHQELYRDRITPADVRWACDLAGRVTDEQWHQLFAATGYEPATANQFIATLEKRIEQGRSIEATPSGR